MADITIFFTEDQRTRINQAITEAERGTSAEIVPVLTDTSGAYDRAEDTFGLLFACVAVTFVWIGLQGVDADAAWTTAARPALTYPLHMVIVTFIVAFVVGAALASRVWAVRHLFTSRAEMRDCLRRGAERAFHVHSLSGTKGRTGVLIYVSLFERMVHVLGDATVAEKLTDADFGNVKDAVIEGFKKGERCEGLCRAISLCGSRLRASFPASDDDENELPNELILFEQNL